MNKMVSISSSVIGEIKSKGIALDSVWGAIVGSFHRSS